jgi:DnaK suppressor protein
MPSKKPGIKQSKSKKPAASKPVARRPEPARPAAASRKAVAASSAKPAVKPAASRPAATAKPEVRPATRSGASHHGPASGSVAAETTRPVAASQQARIIALPDSDDGDGGESSLLAGPRNVKPYVAKRGELYMSKQQLTHFQQILLNWKRDLMEEVDRTVSHMKDEAANFPDPNDRATQEEEFSLELRTRDRERKLIRKIEEALKRIEDGTYR